MALRNVLYLTTYCPALREGIWELIFHHMLSIDVSNVANNSSPSILLILVYVM